MIAFNTEERSGCERLFKVARSMKAVNANRLPMQRYSWAMTAPERESRQSAAAIECAAPVPAPSRGTHVFVQRELLVRQRKMLIAQFA